MELSGQFADLESTNAWCIMAINVFMHLNFSLLLFQIDSSLTCTALLVSIFGLQYLVFERAYPPLCTKKMQYIYGIIGNRGSPLKQILATPLFWMPVNQLLYCQFFFFKSENNIFAHHFFLWNSSQHSVVCHNFFTMITKTNTVKFSFFGEGRRHDSGILADSQLLPLLNRHALSQGGQLMCIYGDPAYIPWGLIWSSRLETGCWPLRCKHSIRLWANSVLQKRRRPVFSPATRVSSAGYLR